MLKLIETNLDFGFDYLTLSRMGRGLTLIYAENAEKPNKKSVFICALRGPRFPRPESNV